MWTITKEIRFNAAHFLPLYDGACRNMHGHEWRVIVTISSNTLDEQGMIMDFSFIKKEVMKYDHKLLNEISPFDTIQPPHFITE